MLGTKLAAKRQKLESEERTAKTAEESEAEEKSSKANFTDLMTAMTAALQAPAANLTAETTTSSSCFPFPPQMPLAGQNGLDPVQLQLQSAYFANLLNAMRMQSQHMMTPTSTVGDDGK